MRRLTALAALGAALVGCGSASEPERRQGISVRVESNPFRVTVLDDGRPVVRHDRDARLRYELAPTGEQHKLTKVISSRGNVYEVATDEPGRTATVTVAKTTDGARLSLRLKPETNVVRVFDAFESKPDDHFLGGGERGDQVDLRGVVVQVKVSWQCVHAAVPYFSSSAGWGLRLDTLNVTALAFPGSPGGTGCVFGEHPACAFPPLANRTEVCVQGARLDEDLYVGSFRETLHSYYADAGRPRLPPSTQFELIKWRDENKGPEEVLEDIRRLKAAKIPIGWVLVDNPWEECQGSMTFDRGRFPDPAGLIRQVHASGVRFMLWVAPKVICDSGYASSERIGTPERQTIDLANPKVYAEFRSRLRKLVALGVDGVKGDRADEIDLEPLGLAVHNRYALLFARAVMAEMPGDAAVILRAAAMGSQSVLPGIWAGDQPGEWVGLKWAIRGAATAAMSGFPVWGSDVGGYSSAKLTAETFARWAQLGAISPVMEVGGSGPNATPWVLGETAMQVLHDAAVLHYELFPYFDRLLRRGEPILRPLGFDYPADPEAWKADLELLVGPDLLAAPVAGPGTTPSVYLPRGSWVDLYSGATVPGGRVFNRTTPLTQFPLYARAGAVIPFNLRTRDSWWGVNELTHAGRAGFLATNGAKLDVRGQPRNVQIFVPAPARPRGVTIGGKAVRWTWHAGPLPGAVVRLRGPAIRGVVVLSS